MIPIGGYNVIIENILKDVEVGLGVDCFDYREELEASANKVAFTGMIDQYFDYKHGVLEYRSLRFKHEVLDEENHQGNAVVNYTDREILYTRIIEHKKLSMFSSLRQSSRVNIQLTGNVEMNHIIQLMMRKIMLSFLNTTKKLHRMIRLSSVDV